MNCIKLTIANNNNLCKIKYFLILNYLVTSITRDPQIG